MIGPPFARTFLRSGYDCDEVDAFFTTISTRTPEEIREVRFKIRFRGYDLQSVDEALDAWAEGRGFSAP